MAAVTINFNGGNSFIVRQQGVTSPQATLPATVHSIDLHITDPVGDYVDPANAGGNFVMGIEYTLDSGSTWKTLTSNGGQPIGSLFKGNLPSCGIVFSGTEECFGQPCRAFASSTTNIRIAALATIQTT